MERLITKEEIDDSKNVFRFNTEEDLTIIWFDDKIDEEIKSTLEHSHDHIQICHSIDGLISIIDDVRNEKIILIVAGRYCRETLSLIHDNNKIDTFYIFCFNKSLYQDLIDEKKYSKLFGIYTEYQSLFTILKQQIHLILKHLSIFNLFQHIDKPIRDLEYESSNYLWYQLFRDTLMTMETENDQCKQQLIDYCRSYYRLNKKYLEQIDTFEQTYQSFDAIRWYTKDSFLYRFVNKALRTEDIEALFRLRYFIKDLCKNLKLLFDKNFEIYQDSLDKILVYRGLTLPMTVIDQLKQSIGKYVSTNGFLSTTFKRDVAEMFGANVIFEIKIETDLKNIIYAYISKLSFNPSEDEVLFDLGAIFQIIDVQYKDNKYIVTMIGINNNIEYLKSDYFQVERDYLQENSIDNILSNINAHSLFGKFLLMIDSTKKAIDYFEELYKNRLANNDNALLNEYEIYIITGNLADAYADNNQYDLALKYAFHSYNIHKNFQNNYSVSIAASLLRISLIYLNTGQIQSAFDCIQDAFRNIPVNCNSQLLGPLHLCISRCYLKQTNYSNALKHCQESLEKFTETKNNIALSETHYTLAQIYQNQLNNDMAVEHYEQSLVLQKNIYSNSHPIRIRTNFSLAQIYYITEKYDSSIYYYLEILKNKQFNDNDKNEQIDMIHNYLACCYFKLKKYDLAIEHANLSLIISEKSLDIERIELSYTLMGDIFDEQQKYDLSIECYENLVKKSMEYNNYKIMKTARSKYISSMTYLITEEYDNNFEKNIEALSKFYEKYLYPENLFIFDDLQQILITIVLIYMRTKKFSFGIDQMKIMLIEVERQPNSYDKNKIVLVLTKQIAWLYEKDEKYHLAIIQYRMTLTKIKDLHNNGLLVHFIDIALMCYESIGQLYYQSDEYELAIENQLEGLELIEQLNNNQYEQENFNFNYTIANCYIELDKHALARIYYIKCIEIERKSSIIVNDSEESIYMYEIVGNSYYENKQYDLAIDCYKKALNIIQTDDDSEISTDVFQFNYKIGCCYKIQENLDLFLNHFQIALKTHENHQSDDNKYQIIDIYFQLGWFYQQNKQYDLALEYFQKMLDIQKTLNTDDITDVADSYIRIGKCYQEKSMSHLSLTFYEQALHIYTQINAPNTIEKRKIADLHWRIGKIYQIKHEYNMSIEYFESSLKFLPVLNIKLLFDIYSELGFCYQQISNGTVMAIDYYKKAIEIQQEIKPYENSKIIQFYYEIGLYYQKIQEFYSAIQYFKSAQELFDEQDEKDFIKSADIYAQIGFCFCDTEDWNSSVNHCLIAFGLYQSIEVYNHPHIYRLCITIAHCYGQQEMYTSAIPYFDQALKVQEDNNNHDIDKKSEIIHLNNQLGFCYYMSDQYDIAYFYYNKSIETAKNSSFYTEHFSMADNYEMLGYIYIHYNQKILADRCLKKALKFLESTESINALRIKHIRNLLK